MPEISTKIYAAAQISSTRGQVTSNLETHARVMEQAAEEGVQVLVFPELSLTGYELDLGESLQLSPDDALFAPLQSLAHDAGMLTLIGAPLKAPAGKPYLGAVVLGGDRPKGYAKMHVHTSESDWFQPGPGHVVSYHKGARVGAAICADLTHASHAAGARALGADLYAVGALINEAAWIREEALLEGYAREHDMTVIFANYAKKSGAYEPVGNSSIWAPGGQLVARVDGKTESLLIADGTGVTWKAKSLAL